MEHNQDKSEEEWDWKKELEVSDFNLRHHGSKEKAIAYRIYFQNQQISGLQKRVDDLQKENRKWTDNVIRNIIIVIFAALAIYLLGGLPDSLPNEQGYCDSRYDTDC